MGTQTKGFCKYCGKEYTRSGMLRHLEACKERKSKLAMETYKRKCRYFQIVISGKYAKAYWLIVEVSENTTLKELDQFIVEKAGLWLDGGAMFGPSGADFQRVNIACPRATLELALDKLKAAVDNLG